MSAACVRNRFRFVSDPSISNDHSSECLRCQAEAAKYRSLLRHLSKMSHELVQAPAGLSEIVGRSLSGAPDLPKKSRGSEVVLTAAGIVAMAGAVTLWRRRISA